jgi:hypothetical protein
VWINCPYIGEVELLQWVDRPAGGEPVLTLSQAWKGKQSCDGGTVRLAWNGRDFLVRACLPDQDIFNPATHFNEAAYLLGDVFEVFLKPISQEAYYEIHVTPGNLQYQVRFAQDKATLKAGQSHPFTFVRMPVCSATHIDHARDQWTVDVQIPLGPICENLPVLSGSEWLVSFSRYDYTRTATGMVIENYSTSPHQELSFHRQHEWSRLRLG